MVARLISLTCTEHTQIPTAVKHTPSVSQLSRFAD